MWVLNVFYDGIGAESGVPCSKHLRLFDGPESVLVHFGHVLDHHPLKRS